MIHIPVLPEETASLLAPKRAGEYMLDCTLGEGGHSELFLRRFPDLRITGIDADGAILEAARERLKGFGGRMEFYHGWSRDFLDGLRGADGAERPGIILLDLGVSLYHYEKSGRGFSFRRNEPLDMRIDTEKGVSAAEILARYGEKELADLLYANAEERYSRRIARAIVEARRKTPIADTEALERVVWNAVPASQRRRTHPATKTFQALRIAVNGELEGLPGLLEAAFAVLRTGGRMGVITFHSLEDRIVKNFFRAIANGRLTEAGADAGGAVGGAFGTGAKTPIKKEALLLTRKPVLPSREEVRANAPSRSAKLRVVEKIG